jgi:hypothetical protein
MRYAVIVFIVSLASISASAQNLIVDGLTGYGLNVPPPGNPFNVSIRNSQRIGLGLRVGYKFNPSIYLGLSFVSHFGSESSSTVFQGSPNGGSTPIGTATTTTQTRYVNLDFGYQFEKGQIRIRPMLSFGMLGVIFKSSLSSESEGDFNITGRPALLTSYQFTKEFSLGVEACYIKSLNRWSSSFADGYSFFLVASYSLY